MKRIASVSTSTSAALTVTLLSAALPARAQPAAFCDPSPELATLDGDIGAGEYPSTWTGVGDGFGKLLGEGVSMSLDSDPDGQLRIAIDATGGNCDWGPDNTVVLYLDTLSVAGFAGTASFNDFTDENGNFDAGRAAASGVNAGGRAELVFPPGFGADFAIVLRSDSANLFGLRAQEPHSFIRSLERAPANGASCVKEFGGITLNDVQSRPGNPVRWLATLVNPADASGAFRANEFQGVSASSIPSGNIGIAPLTIAAGDYNTLKTYATVDFRRHPVWEDFTTFTGAGFSPMPACGQLSSELWAVEGASEGAVGFGEVAEAGDLARGLSAGTASQGGVYAFEVAPGDFALGVVATGTDFTPGAFTLRLRNERDRTLEGVGVGYAAYSRNDEDRSGLLAFSISTDGENFAPAPELDLVTPEAREPDPVAWARAERTASFNVSVPPGGFVYLRWSLDDVEGDGSRDKLAIDDLVIEPVYGRCGDGAVNDDEVCDEGASNGTSPCGCQWTCTYGEAGAPCGDAAAGACDAPDACDGAGACEDLYAEDGTSCADDDACNGEERCSLGQCSAGEPVDCPDGDVCNPGICIEPGVCELAPIDGCCTQDAQCDDLDPGTRDGCDLGSNTCTFTPILVDAGPGDAGADPDAGVPVIDAGAPADDAGIADAGMAADDAGANDAGALDAGISTGDGGPPFADAGDIDAGALGADAGVPGEDAGAAGADAGVPGEDAGIPNQDGGVSGEDAGVSGKDAGTAADGGSEPVDGGCSCEGSGATEAPLWAMALGLLALARRRRR